VVCTLATHQAVAQRKYHLRIMLADTSVQASLKVKQSSVFQDSIAVIKYIQRTVKALHNKSYLLASVDSISFRKDSVEAYIHSGEAIKWATLKPGNVEENLLSQVGYREKFYKNRLFSYKQVSKLEEQILRYADNQGYPFASISLDSIGFTHNTIRANLRYIKGPYIIFDSIHVQGKARLKSKFLFSYLRLVPGQPFSQRKVEQAEKLLKQLPYIAVTQPFGLIFKNERAYPVFYMSQVAANSVDGIIGFLPGEKEGNKLLITGELNLQLRNLFSSGKSFSLKWQQIRPESPRLDISYEHPALLGTPFHLKGNFNILKEDTTFLTIDRQISIGYFTGNAGKISFLAGIKHSQLGSNAQYKESVELPVFSDYRYLYYGIDYQWNHTDDLRNPLKGFIVSAGAWAGNKKISKNPFVAEELYENVPQHSLQILAKAAIDTYFPINSRSVWVTSLEGGKIANSNLFKNDLFRLGGLTSLRGHNENFFFASDYAILTLEYRYFIEPTSYLFLFYDQAYLKHSIPGSYYDDHPLGTGIGVSFTTNLGIFQLIYAMGQSQDRKFGFNFARIHFGLTSKF
jgi:translocation and assembly module TamA